MGKTRDMKGVAGNDNNVHGSKAIPTRRVILNDPSQMPSDYSSTPGGTLFSTTPGGVAGNDNNVHGSKAIPTRRVILNDPSQMPSDYSSTPGGTLFSTTPGGTRIIYDRKFLLQMRNSPLTKSPPTNLPNIPGVTSAKENSSENGYPEPIEEKPKKESAEDAQFQMDI